MPYSSKAALLNLLRTFLTLSVCCTVSASTLPAFAQNIPHPAPMAGKGVVVPPVGPQVGLATARKKLRDNMPQQIAEFMKLHNDARAEVGVPPLQWDTKLSDIAQKWADHLAAKGSDLEHSNNPYGENLAGYLPQYGERPVHGAKMWYDEKAKYHGEAIDDTNYMTFGHYTQMVWARTTKVGFGIAMASDGMAILCANYDIGGNMRGERPYEPAGKPAANAPQPQNPPQPQAVPQPQNPPQKDGVALANFEMGGITIGFPRQWTNTYDATGRKISSFSPDNTVWLFLKFSKKTSFDPVQESMTKDILKPLMPDLSDVQEVNTQHDIAHGGLGFRVITYTAKINDQPVDIVVELGKAQHNDAAPTVLLIHCVDKGVTKYDGPIAQVSQSMRLTKNR